MAPDTSDSWHNLGLTNALCFHDFNHNLVSTGRLIFEGHCSFGIGATRQECFVQHPTGITFPYEPPASKPYLFWWNLAPTAKGVQAELAMVACGDKSVDLPSEFACYVCDVPGTDVCSSAAAWGHDAPTCSWHDAYSDDPLMNSKEPYIRGRTLPSKLIARSKVIHACFNHPNARAMANMHHVMDNVPPISPSACAGCKVCTESNITNLPSDKHMRDKTEWGHFAVDFVTDLPTSYFGNYKQALVCVELMSGYLIAIPVQRRSQYQDA